MSLYKTFARDATKETSGIWVPFPANDDKTIPRFNLARMGRTNPRYQAAVTKIGKSHRREINLDVLSEEVARPLLVEVFCTTVLLGWENVQDPDGNIVPYSKEAAIKLMTDLPDLYDVLEDEAKRLSNFQSAATEDDVKN